MSDIAAKLRAWCIDWNGALMVRGEPPRDGLHCDDLLDAAAEIERLRAALEQIADIGDGSRTVNSLPHIAKIARAALAGPREQEQPNGL